MLPAGMIKIWFRATRSTTKGKDYIFCQFTANNYFFRTSNDDFIIKIFNTIDMKFVHFLHNWFCPVDRSCVFHKENNNRCLRFVPFSTPTTPVAERVNFLPTIDVGKVGDDESEAEDPYSWRMTDYYRSMTSLVLERSSKSPQSWVRKFFYIIIYSLWQ